MMNTIKKWLSTVVTGLLLIVLFGIIFIQLELVELSSGFFLELGITASLITIIRIFWYNDGEDRAIRAADIKLLKTDYSTLVKTTIKSYEDLETFIKELNEENRQNWVFHKLKGRTKDNYKDYDKLYQNLTEKSYAKVPVITSTQILTRSANYETINAKDYTSVKKAWYQASSLAMSIGMTILLSVIAYKEIMIDWTNLFRYLSYVFNIAWALISSLFSGYNNYRHTTLDHISRLTMIVNRYAEWCKGGKKCRSEQEQTTQISNKNI